MHSEQLLCVSTTLDSQVAARAMAKNLVEFGQAACVQVIGPIESVYRWQGKLEQAEEWLCIAKTDRAHFAALQDIILKHHPYDEPEVIATEIVAGSEGYLAWLGKQLT